MRWTVARKPSTIKGLDCTLSAGEGHRIQEGHPSAPKVEHPFLIVKRRFGHLRTRYRGTGKNLLDPLCVSFALANLAMCISGRQVPRLPARSCLRRAPAPPGCMHGAGRAAGERSGSLPGPGTGALPPCPAASALAAGLPRCWKGINHRFPRETMINAVRRSRIIRTAGVGRCCQSLHIMPSTCGYTII